VRRLAVVAPLLVALACSATPAGQSPSPDTSSADSSAQVASLECLEDDRVLGVNREVGGPGLDSRRAAAASAFSGMSLDFGGLDSDEDGLVWRRDGRVVARAEIRAAPGGGWHGDGARACGELQRRDR